MKTAAVLYFSFLALLLLTIWCVDGSISLRWLGCFLFECGIAACTGFAFFHMTK